MLNSFVLNVKLHTNLDIAKNLPVVEMHRFTLENRGEQASDKSDLILGSLEEICGQKEYVGVQVKPFANVVANFVIAFDASDQPVHHESASAAVKYAVLLRSAHRLSAEFSPESQRLDPSVRMQISKLHQLGFKVIVVFICIQRHEIFELLNEALTSDEMKGRPLQFLPRQYVNLASKINLTPILI